MTNKTDQIIYRPVRENDFSVLLKLLSELYCRHTENNFPRVIKSLLEDKNYFKLGVFDGENIVGFILGSQRLEVDFECQAGIIEEIVVAEKYRGKGIGRELLKYFTDWAKKKKCEGILVPCGREGFYEKVGFEKFVVKRYWRKIKP